MHLGLSTTRNSSSYKIYVRAIVSAHVKSEILKTLLLANQYALSANTILGLLRAQIKSSYAEIDKFIKWMILDNLGSLKVSLRYFFHFSLETSTVLIARIICLMKVHPVKWVWAQVVGNVSGLSFTSFDA